MGTKEFYQRFRLAAVTENFVLTYSACTVLSEPHSQLRVKVTGEKRNGVNRETEKWVLLSTMLA